MSSQVVKDTKENRHLWGVTVIIALVGAFFFVRPFFSLIILSLLMAYLFNPAYKWTLKKVGNSKSAAATLTTLFSIFVVGLPVLAIVAIAVAQGIKLVDTLGLGEVFANNSDYTTALQSLVDYVNKLISSGTGIKDALSYDQVLSFFQSTLPQVIQSLIDALLGIVSGIPGFFMNLIIYLFLFTGILVNQTRLLEVVRYLSPFEDHVNDLYLKRIGAMTSAMVRGQFIIAFAQGLATAAALAIVGLESYFLFFTLIFTFLSIIPLGAGVITIPLGIIMILLGDVWQGSLVLINHFVVVTNIDNVLRPKLVPKNARLAASLIILSALSGVLYFGVLGVVYGPVIMIVIVTTIETYVNMRKAQIKAA